MALVLADASKGATAASLGGSGSALGFTGIPGVAVVFDTYRNSGEPGPNVVGIVTGATTFKNNINTALTQIGASLVTNS